MTGTQSSEAFEELGDRLFAFYPPIVNVEHNEWRVKRIEWSEIEFENPQMGLQLWVPRTYLGDVSRIEEPHLIVGLKRELEYKAGSLVPYHPKVVGMPRPHLAPPSKIREMTPQPTLADDFRSNAGPEGNLVKGLLIALVAALVLITAAVGLQRLRSSGGEIRYQALEQRDLSFTADTTYFDIVRQLGSPEEDHWRQGGGERAFRALVYQKEGLTLILMGPEQNDSARYIGAKDPNWRTVHSVQLPGGRTTEATLGSLKRF